MDSVEAAVKITELIVGKLNVESMAPNFLDKEDVPKYLGEQYGKLFGTIHHWVVAAQDLEANR